MTIKLIALLALIIFSVPSSAAESSNTAATPNAPQLILQLTIDQLRGDMLPRYHHRLGPNGFRRLTDRGLYFANAHYSTGNTFTASGHAVLVTGADTAEHGMVANEWFDRESSNVMYSTFDPKHGMSPANLTSTTIGDELVSASRQSRAFAIAGKDRSAIIPAGHLGKAFWFSDKDGGFVSSTYHYETLPAWTQAWNVAKPIEKYRAREWTLLGHADNYANARNSANSYARPNPGATFPHSLAIDDTKKFITAFRTTPLLDEHTLNFAQELINQEKVGQGAATDYLAISLSGTDYIGHTYGPNSLEYEDGLLRLDAKLSALFSYLDKTIGANRYLIVLSADHGIDDIPEAHKADGYDAERFYPKKLLEQMNSALKARFDTTEDLITAFAPPGFYLNVAAIERVTNRPGEEGSLKGAGVGGSGDLGTVPTREAVEQALAEELRNVPGVAYAYTRTQMINGQLPTTELGRKIQRSYHPTRSGDVIIIQKQHWYLYHDAECCASMHGSPYSYDTFVPVIFYGPGIPARTVSRSIEPASIAPTLAALLKIKPPSGNSAIVLPEVIDHRR